VADSVLPVRYTLTEIARSLPTDASLEDVQYHLYVRQQIEAGLADEEAGRLIDTDEMRKRLAAHNRARENRGQ
jgi:predicted transcriptional regulator